MKGSVYEIFNPEKDCYYIGSSYHKFPKKRYYRHRQDCMLGMERYFDLFDCVDMRPNFKIIDEGEYETIYELREKENYYLNSYRQSGKNCTNKNMPYVPEHLKATAIKVAKRKYNQTPNGKAKRKEQNKRYREKQKLKSILNQNAKEEGSSPQGL